MQRDSFEYFRPAVLADTALVLDKSAANWSTSITALGTTLTLHTVGTPREFIERPTAAARMLAIARFLIACERRESAQITDCRGFLLQLSADKQRPARLARPQRGF